MTSIAQVDEHPLADAIRTRYLNYSLSVITSRALPDVRDGLKPSQRRILVAMNDLSLGPNAKYRKSAKICGDTSGNYHPHGEQVIYPTLVRMAQPFNLRHPLVDGQGNFGSLDGDNAAAMRYTEARMTSLAMELMAEIKQNTVDFRDNYDGTRREPYVLPARFPQLLVNGSSGIAVGMATSIPPHNLDEVIRALLRLIDSPGTSIARLTNIVKGPDFPTGGVLLNSKEEIREIYSRGQGSFRLRGEYDIERAARGKQNLVITSIPYGVNKAQLVEKIGANIAAKKVPQLVDVRDESTEEVRVVCELRSGADPEAAIAFLYRHTDLQTTFPVNMNCLIPTQVAGVTRPERLDLAGMLRQFLDFRFEVVRRRLEYELAKLEERIHILRGFAIIFDHLDQAIKIIRRSEGKTDAAVKLIKKFGIDDIQAEAILETKLYRLAKLEIQKILDELADKEKQARRLRSILKSKAKMEALVKDELQAVAKKYGEKRRTSLGADEEDLEFDPEAYIIEEDAYVILTRDGRVKRQGKIRTVESIRVREGDAVLAITAGRTTHNVAFLSSLGSIYVSRIAEITPTTGHGDPIQKMFKFADGEKAIAAFSMDPRFSPPLPVDAEEQDPPGPHILVLSQGGYGFRMSLAGHDEPTTRNGRRYARLAKGDEIVGALPVTGEEAIVSATRGGRVLLSPACEVSILSGAGRGVIIHKVSAQDEIIGFDTVLYETDVVTIEKSGGKEAKVSARKYRVTSRAGRGFELVKRGGLKRLLPRPVTIPSFEE